MKTKLLRKRVRIEFEYLMDIESLRDVKKKWMAMEKIVNPESISGTYRIDMIQSELDPSSPPGFYNVYLTLMNAEET